VIRSYRLTETAQRHIDEIAAFTPTAESADAIGFGRAFAIVGDHPCHDGRRLDYFGVRSPCAARLPGAAMRVTSLFKMAQLRGGGQVPRGHVKMIWAPSDMS
jgi:hypothetical protein